MRIAGGVLLFIVGLWSMVGGGCSLFVGGAASHGADMAAQVSAELAAETGATMDPEAQEAFQQAQTTAGSVGSLALVAGAVILVGGILCFVAGILFLVNKARIFGFIAPGVGILGEILFFALLAFNILGLVKILILGFTAFAATSIEAEDA